MVLQAYCPKNLISPFAFCVIICAFAASGLAQGKVDPSLPKYKPAAGLSGLI